MELKGASRFFKELIKDALQLIMVSFATQIGLNIANKLIAPPKDVEPLDPEDLEEDEEDTDEEEDDEDS